MLTETQTSDLKEIDNIIFIELKKLANLISTISFKEITTFELNEIHITLCL